MVEHLSHNIQNRIQKELFNAKQSIKIVVAWFTNDLLFQPLVLKQATGVKVEVILNKDDINCSDDNNINFFELVNKGGIVRWNDTKQLMHDKFCIIDDSIVIYGSYNWTNKAEYNEESITISRNEFGTTKFYLDKFLNLSNKYPAEKGAPMPQMPLVNNEYAPIDIVRLSNEKKRWLLQNPYYPSHPKKITSYNKLNFYEGIEYLDIGNSKKIPIAKMKNSYFFINSTNWLPYSGVEFSEYKRGRNDAEYWLRVGGKWGLCTISTRTFSYAPIFDEIRYLIDDIELLRINNKWGAIESKNGLSHIILECKYDEIRCEYGRTLCLIFNGINSKYNY